MEATTNNVQDAYVEEENTVLQHVHTSILLYDLLTGTLIQQFKLALISLSI